MCKGKLMQDAGICKGKLLEDTGICKVILVQMPVYVKVNW